MDKQEGFKMIYRTSVSYTHLESERLRYFFIPFVYSDKEDPWRKYKMPGADRLKEA